MNHFRYLILLGIYSILNIGCLIAQNEKKDDAYHARVAILGESYNHENHKGFNEEILKRLFSLIKLKEPQAVIFTGNMTLGLEKQTDSEPNSDSDVPTRLPGLETGKYADKWPQEGFIYNTQKYRDQLEAFRLLFNTYAGEQTPFYPIIGKHESFGQDSVAIFLETFKVENMAPNMSPLAYTFSIQNAFFVVFSISRFDGDGKTPSESVIHPTLRNWIDRMLKENAKKYDYLFVVGNEPAFSTTATTGNYRGLDKHPVERDSFWRVLLSNHVTAYFCSREHLYDRTNRYGIWQVISGGAGAPLYKREFDRAFYHYILLNIPKNKQKPPKVQLYDVHGNLNDEFEITPTHYPVYQLRISNS